MKIWRKLLYFGIGAGMGTLIVMFLFGDRDIQCSYFPNDRVLYDMRKKQVSYSQEARRAMQQLEIDTADISAMLLGGDVDFGRSNTDQEDSCKTYWIDFERVEDAAISGHWRNCDSSLTLMEIRRRP